MRMKATKATLCPSCQRQGLTRTTIGNSDFKSAIYACDRCKWTKSVLLVVNGKRGVKGDAISADEKKLFGSISIKNRGE
jgi:hypothetical protein